MGNGESQERYSPQIFISYTRRTEDDKAFASKVYSRIQAMGYHAWMDVKELIAGRTWDTDVQEALVASEIIVGIMSPESVKSKSVLDEWVWAIESKKPLLLIKYKECTPSHRFIRLQHIDFTSHPEEACFKQLSDDLEKNLQSATLPTPSTSLTPPIVPVDVPSNFEPILNIKMLYRPDWICVSDEEIWSSDGRHAEVHSFRKENSAIRWALPDQEWKCRMPILWQDALVCSDWSGSIFLFGKKGRIQPEKFTNNKYDALPIHRLVLSPRGSLISASWDGHIRAWDSDLQPKEGFLIKLTHLPTHVVPLSEHQIVVADQTGTISCFTSDGIVVWNWKVEGPIGDLWTYESRAGAANIIAIVNRQTVVHYDAIRKTEERIQLSAQVVAYSQTGFATEDKWFLFALEGGKVVWVSWSPFELYAQASLQLEFEIRQIEATQPEEFSALGLTQEGAFFTINQQNCRVYAPSSIQRVILDKSQRSMFWVLEDHIELHRNPQNPPSLFKVDLKEIRGELTVDEYHEVTIVLKNNSAVPIAYIEATLSGGNRISDYCRVELRDHHFSSGEYIELQFSICAKVAGSRVPLELEVSIEDELGPPASRIVYEVHVTVKDKAS